MEALSANKQLRGVALVSYLQHPYIACQGEMKSLGYLDKGNEELEFVAQMIEASNMLWLEIKETLDSQDVLAYREIITAYTLAYYVDDYGDFPFKKALINIDRNIHSEVKKKVSEIIGLVSDHILQSENVVEYAKSRECWQSLVSLANTQS